MRKDELQKKLEDALRTRCEGANLLEAKGDRMIFNYPGNILHESQKYQIKFELKDGGVVLADNSQRIVEVVQPPEELICETSDPDPAIVGTPKAVLTLDEKRVIYGQRFTPRKNQEK
jgi:hypothetical protein